MAAGDVYLNCDNSSLSTSQIINLLIRQDSIGRPTLNTNASGFVPSNNIVWDGVDDIWDGINDLTF